MRIGLFTGLLLISSLLQAQITNFPWPLAPMTEQHRISATFDECREDRDHFHNGIDIPLGQGGEVLSIMSGQVLSFEDYGGNAYIRVEDFAYVHVDPNPALTVGSYVTVGQVIGWTNDQNHIHMNYGGGASGHPTGNALMPNRIQPFVDTYHPRSPDIWFTPDGSFSPFPGTNLSGHVDIIAHASDTTDLESNIDMNNGIYEIGWALYSADTSTVLAGPSFWFEANQLYSNAYIENVYAPGSNTSTYIYIVTNRVTSNGYLNCDLYTPGPYVVSVMSRDTRENWDTTYVNITINEEDLFPPGQPTLEFVGANADGELHLEWIPPEDPDLLGYRLEFSFDGGSWASNHGPDVLTADMTSFTVAGFPQNGDINFRLIAMDTAPLPNESLPSDGYGGRLDADAPQILIVDGFDRTSGSWGQIRHEFAMSYSQAVIDAGVTAGITTVSNEWALSTGTLSGYDAVIWFVGDDSRTDETFSTAEQTLIRNYLDNGGKFFTSGAEIGYDLAFGNSTDLTFLNDYLHVDYAGDDANDYNLQGTGSYFSGLSMTYGSEPYTEDWPDYFTATSGGQVGVKYGNDLNAGIYYANGATRTFTLGMTFETIAGADNRAALMERIMAFFWDLQSSLDPLHPTTALLGAAYPNPFNAQVLVPLKVISPENYRYRVFDLTGRSVYTHRWKSFQPGAHTLAWTGRDDNGKSVASGSYLIALENDGGRVSSQLITVIK